MPDFPSHESRWDLVVEIAAKMWVDGEYVSELDGVPTQSLVDHQWAAHQAGRVLGGRATVRLTRPVDPDERNVTLTATYVDPTGRGLQRAEEGLESLLRLVLEEQGGSG
jgi:hypothetical protein